MILGVDVSRWQTSVNWTVLKANGVEFAIIKATQGNYTVDQKLREHVAGATAAGIIVGAYHWCDPSVDRVSQARYFLNAIQGLPIRFLAADVEQQWASWEEWSRGSITQIFSPTEISENARIIVTTWQQSSQLPVVVYSRASFINQYARPASNWLPRYPLWMAHYPYRAGRITTTWEVFKRDYQPTIAGPAMPTGCPTWTFWQFTGDKFILPGVTTALDVNYFNGDIAALQRFAGVTVTEPEPEPEPTLTLEERVARLETAARNHGWTL
jgi:GH25 family lysozyme M1 (1,4-beta-N-acetylmuramidase)